MLEGSALLEQLREAWRARERAASIYPVMSFEPEGLVLGAGTVPVPAYAKRRLMRLDGDEARVHREAGHGRRLSAPDRNIGRDQKRIR